MPSSERPRLSDLGDKIESSDKEIRASVSSKATRKKQRRMSPLQVVSSRFRMAILSVGGSVGSIADITKMSKELLALAEQRGVGADDLAKFFTAQLRRMIGEPAPTPRVLYYHILQNFNQLRADLGL